MLPLFVLGAVAFVLIWPGGQAPHQTYDSIQYVEWSFRRGVGYPLFLSIFGTGPTLPIAQTILSIVCWMYLGYQAGGRAGAVLALVPACTLEIAQYNVLMLSESISTPLFAAMMGLTLHLMRKASIALAVIWCAVAMLFAFTKTSNLYLVFCLPMVLALRLPGFAAVCFGWCMVLFTVNGQLQASASERYKAETINHVYLYRVLPHEDAFEHFVSKGLPVHYWTRSYIAKEPKLAVYNSDLKIQAHELLDTYPDYQQWMLDHGQGEYLKWLIKRPATYLEVLLGIRHSLGYYVLHAEGADLPAFSRALDWRYKLFGKLPVILWIGCLAIPAIEFLRHRRLPQQEALAILAMVPFAYAHSFISYHGHPGDVSRYLLPATAFYRLTILLAVLWLVRQLAARFAASKTDPGTPADLPPPC